MATFWAWTSMIVLLLLGLFLMIIVLLQRGRGGGLAGAFGGMGGQSAFGTKAGDVFTKITIVVALFWVGMAGVSGFILRAAAEQPAAAFGEEEPAAAVSEDPEIPSAAEVPESPQPPAGASGDAPAGAEEGAGGPDLGSPAEATPEPAASEGESSESTETPESGETSEAQN